MMYDFLLYMWVNRRVTESQLNAFADYGYITQAQADSIIATPQN